MGKKMRIFNSILAVSIFFSSLVYAEDKRYIIDKTHFSLGFLVEHAGYAKTLGMFKNIDGSYIYNEESNIVSDVKINIDNSSVFTNHDKRDAHLRSPDFLNVEEYPLMTFKAARNDLNANPDQIKGELTLLGISKPLTLNVKINKIAQYPFRVGITKPIVMGVSANASFLRSDFDMNYAIKKNLVGDQIDLIIEFEARQQ